LSDLLLDIDPSWDVEITSLKSNIEAVLFVATTPVSLIELSEACEMPLDSTRLALGLLIKDYETSGRGLTIHNVDGGYQILTKKECAEAVLKYQRQDRPVPSLSRAALEVLAIIAYKQPVTRAELETIRGVSSDSALRTLLDRGLVAEVGKKAVVGKPSLFGTTHLFLQKFGLNSTSDLPPLQAPEELFE